jgi:hypothetical protein
MKQRLIKVMMMRYQEGGDSFGKPVLTMWLGGQRRRLYTNKAAAGRHGTSSRVSRINEYHAETGQS